ncbi:MAG: SMEK domain-containing protein [bacterium]
MENQNLINQIIDYFSRIESSTKNSNSNGLTDINIFLEDVFCKLLNKVFDLNLVNLNILKSSFPSVDLGDGARKISFQVTSETTLKKIKETIKKFEDSGLSSKFDSLKFLIITTKKLNFKAKIKGPKNVSFDQNEDIITLSKLVKVIRPLDASKIREIHDLLRDEFDSQKDRKSEQVLTNEVETIADLVVFLSNNKEISDKNWTEEPDPGHKIEYRFADKSKFLKSQIIDLLPRYSLARSEVDEKLGLDSVKIDFIRNFLRIKSDIFLTQADGDPKKALDNLTEYFSSEISNKGKKHDYLAIRFYLLDELIKCNVFPNEK